MEHIHIVIQLENNVGGEGVNEEFPGIVSHFTSSLS